MVAYIWSSYLILALISAIATSHAQAAPPALPAWGSDDGFKPFDIVEELRRHFHDHLPSSWFIAEPEKIETGYFIKLGIPVEWGGNPVSAARNLCPDRQSVIWQHIPHIQIEPFYQKRPWAVVECP